MSLRSFRGALAALEAWAAVARLEAEALAFPFAPLVRAQDEDSFEAGFAALNACDAWLTGEGADKLAAIINRPPPSACVAEARSILNVTLPYYDLHPGGLLEAVPHDARRTDCPRIESMARAAMFFDVAVTVFRAPVKAEALFDSMEAMKVGFSRLHELTPVGVRSDYRVSVLDGHYHHPPLWPAEAAELTRTTGVDGGPEAPNPGM